jgi:hypothetical protein
VNIWTETRARLADLVTSHRYTPTGPTPDTDMNTELAGSWPGFHLLADFWKLDTPAVLEIRPRGSALDRVLHLAAYHYPVLMAPGTTTTPLRDGSGHTITGSLLFIVPRAFAQWIDYDISSNERDEQESDLLDMPVTEVHLQCMLRLWEARPGGRFPRGWLDSAVKALLDTSERTGISRSELLEVVVPLFADNAGYTGQFEETVAAAVAVIQSGAHSRQPADH